MGRGTCVPAKIIARLGPGTLMAELRGPGTAFRCVPSYFNPCVYLRMPYLVMLREVEK